MEGGRKEVKPSTSDAIEQSEESSSADVQSYELSDNSHQQLGFSDSLDDPGALFVVQDFAMATGQALEDCNSPSLVPLLHLPQSSSPSLSLVPLSSGLTQKRGPGRPRKDGTSGPIPRKKMNISSFPGRPRMRTRKGTHKAILPPSSVKLGLSALGSENPNFMRVATSLLASSPTKIGTNLGMHTRLPKPIQFSTGTVSLLSSNISSPMELDDTKEIKTLVKISDISRTSSAHSQSIDDYSQESTNKKVCAFCNLGENSLLGQGDLVKFEPSADFSPFKKGLKLRRNSSESETSMSSMLSEAGCSKFSLARRGKGPLRPRSDHGKTIRRSISQETQSIMGPADELELVGFLEEPEATQLFEPSGHVYAHHCCAAWSEGVCQTEEYYLVNVDKAVCNGMSQKCSRCRRFGATIRCRAPKCTRVYHYPCATSSGTFQDIKTLTLLCPFHLLQAPELAGAEANCQVCDLPGVVSELLFCTSCGQHYHGLCLDPPVGVNPVVRAGWQCPECKICQTCRQPGDDNRMLVCDTCDKGFHTFCLKPVMATIPKNGWKCKSCRVCGDCNSRTPGSGPSSRWHLNYTVCDSCYQQRNKGIACPICGKAYRQFCQRADMVHCTLCRKYIHMDCDARLEKMKDPAALNSYVCPVCVNLQAQGIVPGCLALTLPEPFKIKEEREAGPSFLFESTLGSPDFASLSEDAIPENPFSKASCFIQGLPEPMNLPLEDASPPTENSPMISPLYRPMVGGKFPGKKRMGFGRLRGSGKFAGRRRAKTAELRRKRGPKPKVRTLSLPGTPYFPVDPTSQEQIGLHSNASDSRDSKQDDEPTVDNKIILCSATDEFVLSQDLCVMCGSFGQGEEGKLIACSQCGQCYHPYCVNIKITKVILKKGWRCLDCTVCEGCGKPHDEGRLLLCDDCDISYHTYCLDPPLEVVPEGNWKCKWCVKCVECLSTTPGMNCVWQNNYTLCGPCGSKNSCPACQQIYQDQDLIIQCIHCDRWLHGVCDQMLTEDDAEKAADFGYHCLLCRPPDEPPPHLIVEEPPAPTASDDTLRALDTAPDDQSHQMDDSETSQFGFGEGGTGDVPKVKPQAQFMLDGVLLSESGMSQIKALTIEQPKKQRVRRTKLQRSLTSLGLSHQPSGSDVSQPPLILPPAFTVAESRMIDNADLVSLSDPLRTASKLDLDYDLKVENDNMEKKKRQRKLQKLGIGGFQVKPRGRVMSKDSLDSNELGETFNMEAQTTEITEIPALEKPKRRRRAKKKSHLEDSYPNYIQEAFFGKDLLSTSKDISKVDLPLDDETNSSSVHEPVQEKIPIVYNDIPSSSGPSAPQTVNHPVARSMLTPPPIPIPPQSLHHVPPPGPQLIHQGGRPSIGHPQVRIHQHPLQQTPLIIPPPIRQSLPQPMVVPVPAAAPPPPPPPPPGPIVTSSVSFAGKLIGAHQEMMSQREDSLDKSTGDADDSNSKDEDLASSESLKDLLPLPQDDELMDMLIGDDELTKPDDADLGLPQMDSKDVEDIFKDVLSPDNLNEQSSLGSTGMPRGPQQSPAHGSQPSRPPSLPPQTSIHLPGPSTPSSVPSIGSPFSIPPPSPYPSEYSSGTSQFSPQVSEQQLSPWPESESEPQTHSQKNSQKWEIDEALGPMATISPVLYANLIHANLKLDYPLWTDRAKHIAKIWRNLPSDKRQPYLQKARENRTASRMQKTHGVATHGLSPHVPPVGVPQPSPTTPTQPESGKGMNQRSAREIEQERQWKHMQVLRQQQQQQQNQILAEQKQQSFIKVQQSVTMEQHEVSVESGFMQVPPPPVMRSGPSPSPSPSTPTTSAYQSDMSSLCQMTATAGMDTMNQGQPSIQSPASSPFHVSQRSPSSVRSPTSVSPLIQVSRVRPPIDPSRLPPNEQHLGSPGTPRPVENIFLPPYRMPGGPRPGMMHPQQQQQQMLLRPDAPRGQTPSPSAPDFYQTPPSTPCPQQPMDQFRQATSPAHGLLHGQDPFLQLSPNPMQQNAGNSPYSDSQMNQGQVASPLDPYARAPSTPCPPALQPPSQIPTSVPPDNFVMSPSGMNVPVQMQNRMIEHQMQQHPSQSPVSQMQLPPPPSSPMPSGSPGEGFGQGFKVRPQMVPHSQSNVTNPALVAALKPNLATSPLSPRHQLMSPDGSSIGHQLMGTEVGPLGPPASPSTLQDQMEGDGSQMVNRQHLRDLLQRQQMKKQEMMFREQQQVQQQQQPQQHGQMPLRHWSPSSMGDQNRPGGNANLFRPPLPPGMRPRIMSGNQDPTFRHPGQLLEQRGVVALPRAALNDPRIRTALIQQQQQLHQQQLQQQLHQIKHMQQQIQQQHLQCQQNIQQIQMQQPQTMQHQQQLQQIVQKQQQLQQQSQTLQNQKQQLLARATALWNSGQLRLQGQPPRMASGFMGVKSEIGESLGPPPQSPTLQQQQQQQQNVQMEGQPQPQQHMMDKFGQPNVLGMQNVLISSASNLNMASSPLYQQRMMQQQHQQQHHFPGPPQSPLGPPVSPSHMGINQHLDAMNTGVPQSPNMQMSQQPPQQFSQENQHQMLLPPPSPMPKEETNYQRENVQDPALFQNQGREKRISQEGTTDIKEEPGDSEACQLGKLGEETPDDEEEDILGTADAIGKKKQTAGDLVKEVEDQDEEALGVDLEDDLDDDDELLGLGNDFNILEYADPELEGGLVGDGEKNNILDEHLDLDEKDDELDAGDVDELKTKLEEKVDLNKPENVTKKEIEDPDHPDFKLKECKDEKLDPESFKTEQLDVESQNEKKYIIPDKNQTNTTEAQSQNQQNFEPNMMQGGPSNPVLEPNIPDGNRDQNRPDPVLNVSQLLQSQEQRPMIMNQHMQQVSPGLASMLNRGPGNMMGERFPRPIQRTVSFPPGMPPPPPYGANQAYQGLVGQPRIQHPHTQQELLAHQQRMQSLQNPQNVMTLRHRLQSPNQTLMGMGPQNQEDRLTLPQEQPLLLEDLVEQEKQEQKRQSQESFISPPGDALLSDIDFERLKADVLSCPPDDIGGPSGLMSHSMTSESNVPVLGSPTGAPLQHFPPPQSPLSHSDQVGQQPPPPPVWQQHQQHNVPGMQLSHRPVPPGFHNVQLRAMAPQMMHPGRMQSAPMMHGQHGEMHPRMDMTLQGQFGMAPSRPPFPPTVAPPQLPPHDPVTDQDRQQYVLYEQWLVHQQAILTSHQKHFETEVGKLRKNKKSMNARQRQLRRNGQELPDHDQVELSRITQEQTGLQKQLDQVRKQIRQHTTLFQEFRMKQQKFQQQQLMHSGQQNPQGHPSNLGMQLSPLGTAPSPHRPGSVPPQSPMMSPSSMGPSASPRLQHPPSPMMQHSPSHMMQHSPVTMPQSPMMQGPPPGNVSQRSPISASMMMDQNSGPGPRMPHQMIHSQQGIHMQQEDNSFSDRFQQREQFLQHQKRQMMANVNQGDLVGQPFPASLPLQQSQSYPNMSPSASQQSPLSPMQQRSSSQFSPRGNASMSLDDINAIILKSPEGRPPQGSRSQMEMDPTRLGSIHRELTSGQTGAPMMFRDMTFQRPPMQVNQFQQGGAHHMMSRSPRPQMMIQEMPQNSPIQSHNSPSALISQSPRPLSSPLHSSPSNSSMQSSPLIGALQSSPLQSSPVSMPGPIPHYQTRLPSQQASPLHSSPPVSQSTSPGNSGHMSSHPFTHGQKLNETSNSPKTISPPNPLTRPSPESSIKYDNPRSESMDNEGSLESGKNSQQSFEQGASNSQSPKTGADYISDNKSEASSQNQDSGICGKPDSGNTLSSTGDCGRPEGCNTPPRTRDCGRPEGCNTPPPTGNCGRPEGCNTPPPTGNCGRPEGCNTPPPTSNCGRPEGCNTPPTTSNCGRPEGCNTPPPTGNCGRPEGCNTPPPTGNCGRPEGCNTPPPTGNCGRPEGCNTPPPTGNCGRPEGCNTPPPTGNCGRPEGCNTPPPTGNCGRPEGCNTPPPTGNCGRPEGCNTPPPTGNCGRPEGCNTPPPTGNCGRPEGCNTPPPTRNCGRPEGCNTPPPTGNCGRPEGCNTPPPTGNCGRPEGCNTPPSTADSGRPEGCNTLPSIGDCGRPEGCNTPPSTGDCGRPEGCNTPPSTGDCGRPEGCNTPPSTGDCGRPEGCNTPPSTGNCGRPEGCNTPPSTQDCGRPEGCNTPPPTGYCGRPEGCNTPPPTGYCGRPEGCNTPPPTGDCGRHEGCNTPPSTGECGRQEGCNTPPPIGDCGRQEGCNTPPPTGDCGRQEGCNTPPPTGDCGRPGGCNTPPPTGDCGRPEGCNTPPTTGDCGTPESCNTPPPTEYCGRPEGCNTPPPTEDCNTPPPTEDSARPEGCNNPPQTVNSARQEGCNTLPITEDSARPEGCIILPTTEDSARPEQCKTLLPTKDLARLEESNILPPTEDSETPEKYNIIPPTDDSAGPEICNILPPTEDSARLEKCNILPPTEDSARLEKCNILPPIEDSARLEKRNILPTTEDSVKPEKCNILTSTEDSAKPEKCNILLPTVDSARLEKCNILPPTVVSGRLEEYSSLPPTEDFNRPEVYNTLPPTQNLVKPEGCNTLPLSGDNETQQQSNALPTRDDSCKPQVSNSPLESDNCGKFEESNTPPKCDDNMTEDFNSPFKNADCLKYVESNNLHKSDDCIKFEPLNRSPKSGDCGKIEGSNDQIESSDFKEIDESSTLPRSDCKKLKLSNSKTVENDIENKESITLPVIVNSGNMENPNTPPTFNSLNIEASTSPLITVEAHSTQPPIAECKNQSATENNIFTSSVEEHRVSSGDCEQGHQVECNDISHDEIIDNSEKVDCANTQSSLQEILNNSAIMQQRSLLLSVSEPSTLSKHEKMVSKEILTNISLIPSIKNNPEPKELGDNVHESSAINSNLYDSAQENVQAFPTQGIENRKVNETDLTTITQSEETVMSVNEPITTPKSIKDIERNDSEIKAVSTLETLERVVSSSSYISFATSLIPQNVAKTSDFLSLKNNSQSTEITKSPQNICVNPDNGGTVADVSLLAQATASSDDASSKVTSTSEIPSQPLLTVQSDISVLKNVPSSQVISSSVGEIEDSLKKPEKLTQDVKKEVINQQNQQQQLLKQQKQEEKEQLINVPLLKIKDEPVDDISESSTGRFQSVLNRGSESEKASGFDKPVQTMPICSNQSESSNVDELQSSFSQSVTHTLSFTLRQTGMPAGPVSPQPEPSKTMPNIEVSLPVSHIVQQPLTAISQTPSIVVSTSGNHIFATLASQRLTVPQQTSLATLANINPMQITPRPLTPIIKHIPSKTHELHGSLSGRPGPPVMVVGMDGGILRPMEPRGLSLLHLSSSSVSKSIKDESKSLHTSPCKLIAQEIKAEALAMASCQLLQATKLLGSNLKSPKSDPGCSNIVRIDVSRRMSADTLSHNVLERSESRIETAEPSSQNVLLKQLLQNCPSAETTTPKVEDIPAVLNEKIEDGISSGIPSSSTEKKDEKLEESGKVKKMSYLDVRRAQLEKEPTPPPEDPKAKRKRAKKKKDPAKEGGSPTKKRYKKASSLKVDDGHEVFMENLMQQLRALPPIRVLEPRIKPNFNVCSAPGAGDLNAKESCLRGTYGHAHPSSQVDFYASQPFGSNPPTPPSSLPPTPPPIRGYYNQEFPSKSKDQHSSRVDIPVSLPTPPPYLDGIRPMRDTDSPDTIISSSSPECLNMEQTAFTFLKLIDDGNHGRKSGRQSISPVIPLVAPIPIRALPSKIFGTDFKLEYDDLEKDKENTVLEEKPDIIMLKNRILGMGTPPIPLKDSANVSVTLTLSSNASEDIMGVLGKLADILKIPPPSTYEIVGRNVTSPSQKSSLYKKSKDPSAHIHNLLNGKPKFCCHCDIVVLSAGIRKKVSELPYLPKEEMDEDEVIFCSTNCYMQFTLTHRALATTEEKEAAAVVSHTSDCSKQPSPVMENLEDDDDETCDSEVKSIKEAKDKLMIEDKDSSTTLGSLSPLTADVSTTPVSTPQPSKAVPSPAQVCEEDKPEYLITKPDEVETRDSQETASPIMKDDSEILSEEILRKPQKRILSDSEKPTMKQWKGDKWRYWTIKIFSPNFRQNDKEDSSEVLQNMCICLVPDKTLQDIRKCVLCHNVGDGDTNGAARLLNMDVDKWIHLNCALWSAEVYETVNGALINVDLACKRSLNLSCCKCHKTGASLKCFRIRCPAIYHFPCAVKDKCGFFKDKTMLCSYHTTKLDNRDNELDSLAVLRRVYINRDEHKQIASMIQKGEQNLLRIGSLLFLNIGQLLPHQLQAFHTPNCIYPVGYKVIRMYWSMNNLSQRCQYVCSIHDVEGRPEFHVSVKSRGCDEITLKGKTPKDVWLKILEPIEKMRKEANTIKVFPNFITGDDLLGITEPAILRILESLPGVDTLTNYNFKYGRSPLLELPLAINPTGCARSEPKLRTHFKRPHTLHTRNTSRFSMHNTLAGNEVSSPYTKQFVHSKSSQYRKMKTEWRNNVYLARSQIQGLGLYANRDIEKHTMVIEYIGQLIRNEIAERNELIYETQNRGVYMFRVDENRVIDATLCGGLARYMNHCCNPNCVAEVVQIDRENKILIIANRRITRGEELTYDYKFEVEDDQHKIPCLCGAINCRKWMN